MIRYTLWVDEYGGGHRVSGGTAHYRDNKITPVPLNQRYFTLLGIIIEDKTHGTTFYQSLEKLKRDNFGKGGKEGIILRRYDIINFNGPFSVLKDDAKRRHFYSDLSKFLQEQSYHIMAVTVDKETFAEHNRVPNIIHECLSALLSCYCGFLNYAHHRGGVIAEERGKKDDAEMKAAYEDIFKYGTPIMNAAEVHKALSSKRLHFRKKKYNMAGLQIADLLAYPVIQEILKENGRYNLQNSELDKVVLAAAVSKYNMKQKHKRLYCYGKFLIT